MRKGWIVYLGLILTGLPGAQEAEPTPAETPLAVVTTANYRIESQAGEARAQRLGQILEAFLNQFNSYFLFDLAAKPGAFVVKDFADKASFDAALSAIIPGTRRSFAYLSYRDASQNALYTYVGHSDETGALGYQAFVQYLWTFVPNPPTWLQYGFASHFSDFSWNEATGELNPSGRLPYLDLAKSTMGSQAADLAPVLNWNPAVTAGTPTEEALSWALVHYLLNATGPASRLLGNLTAALNPAAPLEANTAALLGRLASYKTPAAFSAELKTFFDAQENFTSLVEKGIQAYRAGQWAQARQWFSQARLLRPSSFLPVYYLGLGAFAQQSWDEAQNLFSEAEALLPPAGLVPLALGMTAFEKKDWPTAKTRLEQAGTENPEYLSTGEPYLAVVNAQLSAASAGR